MPRGILFLAILIIFFKIKDCLPHKWGKIILELSFYRLTFRPISNH